MPLLMFAAGPGPITAVVTLAAFHTPDGFPMTAIIAVVVGTAVTFVAFDPRCSAWTSSRPRDADDSHTLYGAHSIINGNAIRVGRPQGFF